MRSGALLAALAAIMITLAGQAPAQEAVVQPPAGQDAERDYWLAQSKLLDRHDPKNVRANAIFEKVLAAADKRPGPKPELLILDEEGYPWARSLPDGTILLTRGALDICFTAASQDEGDARLAFVIGHELSHQVNGDFWHYFFYQGIHPENVTDHRAKQTLDQVVKIAKSSDSVSAKELAADQYGALYASQAGYKMRSIAGGDKNFFLEWTMATSPWLLEGEVMESTHPKIMERSAAVVLSLNRVLEKIEIFEKGVEAYRTESFVLAKYYFEDFLAVYQSREAFNNLGLVYYRMAAREYALWKSREPEFLLSLILDEKTRASKSLAARLPGKDAWLKNALRSQEEHKSRFIEHIEKSGRYFREAAQRDQEYAMAHNNLACAQFLQEQYAAAVGELDKALALDPDLVEALNNRAVAYIKMAESLSVDLDSKIQTDLQRALALKPDYPYALFNMAYFHMMKGNGPESAKYKKLLLEADPDSELAKALD